MVERVRFRLAEPILRGPLAELWWFMLLKAVVSIAFGAATLAWPRHTAFALIGLFGVYVFVDGVATLLMSVRARRPSRRFSLSLAGATGVAAAVFTYARPRLVALLLIVLMGGWLILRGVLETLNAASLQHEAGGEPAILSRGSAVLLNGGMSVLLGIGLIAAPRIGALGLMWAIGAWAVAHGVLMVPFALGLRRTQRDQVQP